MDQIMERIRKKYGEIPTTFIRMFGEMYLDMREVERWTIPEIAIVCTAITGSFIDKRQNPGQPITTDEILRDAMDSIEAGATAIHLHVRDDQGQAVVDTASYRKVVDPIRQKYGDKVVIDGSCFSGDSFEEQVRPVTDGLFESSEVGAFAAYAGDTVRFQAPKQIQATAEYFREKGVKVQVGLQDTGNIANAKRWLVDTGILEKPYYWHILAGLPGGLYMHSPETMVESLNVMVRALKDIDEDCLIMVYAAGRASIYVATLALLMGLHVRVGLEDTIWRYPHKDELLPSNRDVTQAICQIIRLLGRRVATADEYRRMIGLKK
jgi:3-keto-5-aminohexanoate cleavage enzyme